MAKTNAHYVYTSICEFLSCLYDNLCLSEDKIVPLVTLQALLQPLPPLHLTSVDIEHGKQMFMGVCTRFNVNGCQRKMHLSKTHFKGFDAACTFLTECCVIRNQINVTSSNNVTDSDQFAHHHKTFLEYEKMTHSHFLEGASNVFSLQNLCILGIRQVMPSKTQEDFDWLQLPPRLRCLVTYGDLARRLHCHVMWYHSKDD